MTEHHSPESGCESVQGIRNRAITLVRRTLIDHRGARGNESLVCRAIERHVDGEASSLQESYYPMDIAQECGLLTPRDIPKGTIRTMADHGYVDEITTRMPTPDEARKLGLGTGTPALVYVRTAHTTERPIRLVVTIFAGDRNRIVYELGDLTANENDQ